MGRQHCPLMTRILGCCACATLMLLVDSASATALLFVGDEDRGGDQEEVAPFADIADPATSRARSVPGGVAQNASKFFGEPMLISPPASCLGEMILLCEGTHTTKCLECATSHASQLPKAGCTNDRVNEICKSGEMAVINITITPPSNFNQNEALVFAIPSRPHTPVAF
eukprot:COSAG01_NODE_18829_length_1050_cov_1.220820_1_plen_169_part_00